MQTHHNLDWKVKDKKEFFFLRFGFEFFAKNRIVMRVDYNNFVHTYDAVVVLFSMKLTLAKKRDEEEKQLLWTKNLIIYIILYVKKNDDEEEKIHRTKQVNKR